MGDQSSTENCDGTNQRKRTRLCCATLHVRSEKAQRNRVLLRAVLQQNLHSLHSPVQISLACEICSENNSAVLLGKTCSTWRCSMSLIASDACPPWSFHRLWKRQTNENSWWSSRSTQSWKCILIFATLRLLSFIEERTAILKHVQVQIKQPSASNAMVLRHRERFLYYKIRNSRRLMQGSPKR